MNCRFVGSFYRYDQLPHDNLPQIAFAGRSNVGKSTLLNKLTGHKKLAKVSSTPGKTRSINFYGVNDEFYFVDLPGYGYARVSKTERARWGRLIEEYLEKANMLIGLIVLLDGRRDANERDRELLEWMAHKELPGIAIVTKADKLNRHQVKQKTAEIEGRFGLPAIAFSVVSNLGTKEIQQAILSLVANNSKQIR